MIHKLHLSTQADRGARWLVLEVNGCLTRAHYLILLKRLHWLKRRLGGGTITVDVRGVRHLDPDVLLSLRRRTDPGGMDPVRLYLAEPAELPICLSHVGPDGEVLAHLHPRSGSRRHAGISPRARPQARSKASERKSARRSGQSRRRTVVQRPGEIYDGTLDPETTVRAMSDAALELLVDALYRHLDSPVPSFGASTWFDLATDELQNRREKQEQAPPVLPEAVPGGGRARRQAVPGGVPAPRAFADVPPGAMLPQPPSGGSAGT